MVKIEGLNFRLNLVSFNFKENKITILINTINYKIYNIFQTRWYWHVQNTMIPTNQNKVVKQIQHAWKWNKEMCYQQNTTCKTSKKFKTQYYQQNQLERTRKKISVFVSTLKKMVFWLKEFREFFYWFWKKKNLQLFPFVHYNKFFIFKI